MKIYMVTDLEGATMITRWDQTAKAQATPEALNLSRTLLSDDVNAVLKGIYDASPDPEVVVWDAHGPGGLHPHRIDHRAWVIPRGPITAPFGMDESFDAMFFVGQHAMEGVENAVLAHTYSPRSVRYYKLNGRPIGEFGMMTLLAGEFGIPVVFLSGDDKAVAEAQSMVPGLVGAAVKKGMGLQLAQCMTCPQARTLLREKAAEACTKVQQIPPVALPPPCELEIRTVEPSQVAKWIARGFQFTTECTVSKRTDRIFDFLYYPDALTAK